MSTVHDAYIDQEAHYPVQSVHVVNQALRHEMAFYPLPLGTVYRILRVERFPHEEGYYSILVSGMEFLEHNLALWEQPMPLTRAEQRLHRQVYVIPGDLDLGERLLNPDSYIPGRDFLQTALIELAPFPINPDESRLHHGMDVACQRIANECLFTGDNSSTVSLLSRHLVYRTNGMLASRDVVQLL